MTNREFSILYKLLSYPKKTFTRTLLMDEFWDADTSINMQRIMIMITGAGISIIVVIMSIYMIVRTTKELKEIKELDYGKEE